MQKYLSLLFLLLSAAVSQSLEAQQLQTAGSIINPLSSKNAVANITAYNVEHEINFSSTNLGQFSSASEEPEILAAAMEASFRLKVAKLDGQVMSPVPKRNIHSITIDNNHLMAIRVSSLLKDLLPDQKAD